MPQISEYNLKGLVVLYASLVLEFLNYFERYAYLHKSVASIDVDPCPRCTFQ
jgi:hypothetical protein